MRLTHIKLAGFKSFVEPSKIPFPDQMTCVVGPNGCGKSNVIDAVRWVLGESSAKNLRGDAMTDVIFNGSTHRKPVSQASVELFFDNTSGVLQGSLANRNQIAIKRLVTRDGQSLYFLNGSKCRKRDITDIFLGTGLGPRSYAIIEQGMISRLIESRPQELRVFLEEAAGVSKYKERRRETQTRIQSTRDNLERLLDMRQELKNQLDKLSVQAEQAKQYRELKRDERLLKGQVAVIKWQKLNAQQQQKAAEIAELEKQIRFFSDAHQGHADVLSALEAKLEQDTHKLEDTQQQKHRTHTEIIRFEQQKLSAQQQKTQLQADIDKQKQAFKEAQDALQTLQHAQTEFTEQQQVAEQGLEQAKETLLKAQNTFESSQATHKAQQAKLNAGQHEISEQRQTLQQEEQNLKQAELSLTHLQANIADVAKQIEQQQSQSVIKELDAAKAEFNQLAKQMAGLQSQAKQLSTTLDDAQTHYTKAELEERERAQKLSSCKANISALENVLSSLTEDVQQTLLQTLSVNTSDAAIVESALLGMTLLPVSESTTEHGVWDNTQAPREGSVASLLQGQVYLAFLNQIQLLKQGQRFTPEQGWWMAVDGEGNLYGENFRVSKSKQTSVGLLTQQTQLNELNIELPKLIADLEQTKAQKETRQTRLQVAQQEIESNSASIHQIAQSMAKAQTHSDLLEKQHANWQQTLEQYQQKQGSLKAQLTEQAAPIVKQKQQIADIEAALELLQAQQIELQAQADEQEQAYTQAASHSQTAQQALHQAELELQKVQNTWQIEQTKQLHSQSVLNSALERLETLQQQLEDQQLPLLECEEQLMVLVEQHQEIEIQLEQCQTQKAQAQKALQDKQASLQDAQSGVTKKQNQLQQLKLAEQELMIKAQLMLEPLEELQQTLKDILASLPETPKLVSFQSKLQNTTQQLLELGAVNLAAIEEYDQALERKTYLDEQLDDLTAALETLEGAIRKIDRETKQRFKQTFDQVNKDFAGLFPKVFGGGQAYLELTSDDLLETGVAIMARPPGKKNSTIHLLSGGEKALTALSLVFSIFRLNPAPFCMLDEVDAPLDDANVVRFCRLVEEMSQSVQFIYISHNKIAMEMAGRLTGVTMAEPGVSRMVAVDIEQAVQMAQT